MWIETPGVLNDRLTMIGTVEVPLYLLRGDEKLVLIEGGLKMLGPVITRQLQLLNIPPDTITHLFLLHSHHDHIGLAGYLKNLVPGLKVVASGSTSRILSGPEFAADPRGAVLGEIPVDVLVEDGDIFDLGGITLKIIEAKGHSSEGIALYVPELEIMFISDFAGLKLDKSGSIFPTCFYDVNQYIESLERLYSYRPKIVCLGHFGVATNETADRFFRDALLEVFKFRDRVLSEVNNSSEIGGFVNKAMVDLYTGRLTLIPKQSLMVVLGRMAANILGAVGR